MTRYRHGEQVVARRMEESTVLVHLGTDRILELNETGSRIWELIGAGEGSEAEIVAALAAEFEAPQEAIGSEVGALLARLREERLILALD